MPTVRTSPIASNKRYHEPQVADVIGLNGSGTGTLSITFDVAYDYAPVVLPIPQQGISGTLTAASITKTGFTLTVTGATEFASANYRCGWMAHEAL